jgi:hypothetical protein
MHQYREIFEGIRTRTSMYLVEETYAAAAALVLGYDLACEGGVLVGFHEWLVVRLDGGSNLHWSALVLDAAFPSAKDVHKAVRASPKAQRHAIDTLFELLAEFDQVRAKHDGLKDIFLAFDRWLHKQGIGGSPVSD